MRVWLDPDRLYALWATKGMCHGPAGQNVQVASGVLNQPPVATAACFPNSGADARRLSTRRSSPTSWSSRARPRSFASGRGRIELAAVDYSTNSYRDLDPRLRSPSTSAGLDALATAEKIKSTMDELSKNFRQASNTPSSTTRPIYPTIHRCRHRDHRRGDRPGRPGRHPVPADLARCRIPHVAIPVSLIGTFFFMAMFGFSLNNLSLFGLVLAVGFVVMMRSSWSKRRAQHCPPAWRRGRRQAKHGFEVGSALIAIALVLCACSFQPPFITGLTGRSIGNLPSPSPARL